MGEKCTTNKKKSWSGRKKLKKDFIAYFEANQRLPR